MTRVLRGNTGYRAEFPEWPHWPSLRYGDFAGASSPPRYIPKRTEKGMQISACTCVFTEALFTIDKKWKQPKLNELMNG